ncbi:MAG: UDP-3-O-acyl-N-acetylglucosamine deacetylase [Candidatus Lightella neohaematopini]|nr:UDP-3-O-acyl-N-acetylglucosamine deacetylase [Candidatus Lightella neohaematopini]
MVKQRTIKDIVKITGIGLHTGKKVNMVLKPLSENSGIIYRRIDLIPPVDFIININTICDNKLCTCLVNHNNIRIFTIEHLHAALSGLGIDNILIEVDAPEIPIMDGSAYCFIYLILRVGICELNAYKKFFRIKKSVRVQEYDKWVELLPFNGFKLSFFIDFDHLITNFNKQYYNLNFSTTSFIKNISPARTFGFIKDIKYLHKHGLALGGSIDCVIVIDNNKILNKDGLRFSNEFVRHKLLDAIGDLFLYGYNIIGEFNAFKAGHAINNKLLRTITSNPDSWELITFNSDKESPIKFNIPNSIINNRYYFR